MGRVVGIDLGTTFSGIAHLDETGARMIPDPDGATTVPSVIYFEDQDGEVMVGQTAKDLAIVEPDRVVQFVKREIGYTKDRVRVDDDGVPHPYVFWGRTLSPEQVTSYLLRHLKDQAEAYLGEPVERAVITVPAYFREPERQATLQAAELAGLKVDRLINEPTAAGVAFGLRDGARPQLALVFDLGGGTFDATLLQGGPEGVDVIATKGDHRLGGKDWDDALIEFLKDRFAEETQLDLDDDPGALSELRDRVERAKRRLSEAKSDRVIVSALGKRTVVEVTREEFEGLTENLVERCMSLIGALLEGAGQDLASVDNIVLAGGSTRMPMISAALEEARGRPLDANATNPDECVALGAALVAGSSALRKQEATSGLRLTDAARQSLTKLTLKDVASHNLGFVTLVGDELKSTVVIPRNTKIPCACSREDLTTGRAGQDSLDVHVVEGDNEDPYLCSQTNSFRCSGIPVDLAEPRLQVTFNYDESGVISVDAKELTSGAVLDVERIDPADLDTLLEGTADPMDVVLALDVSGSMSGRPLNEVKDATHRFLDVVNLEMNRVGVVEFGSRAAIVSELSSDHSHLDRVVDGMRISGSTNMAAGIETAESLLKDPRRSRCIVLMSDGSPDNSSAAVSAATAAKKHGCLLITVATGNADREFMESIASSSEYAYDVNATISVAQTFVNLAREIASGSMLRRQSG